MNQDNVVVPFAPKRSLVDRMAEKFSMSEDIFMESVRKMISQVRITGKDGMPDTYGNATDAEIMVFLATADKYDLNPFTRQIYACASDFGGIIPVVQIDGWVALVNRQPRYAGVEFEDHVDKQGAISAISARMNVLQPEAPQGYRTVQTKEYMIECFRPTFSWETYPCRMLRHKAYIQCARIAFGFDGLVDDDEAGRILEAQKARTLHASVSTPPLKVLSNAEKAALQKSNPFSLVLPRQQPASSVVNSATENGDVSSNKGETIIGAADCKTDAEQESLLGNNVDAPKNSNETSSSSQSTEELGLESPATASPPLAVTDGDGDKKSSCRMDGAGDVVTVESKAVKSDGSKTGKAKYPKKDGVADVSDDQKRAYIKNIAEQCAAADGISIENAVYNLSAFEDKKEPGKLIGKHRVEEIKSTLWLEKIYQKAKELEGVLARKLAAPAGNDDSQANQQASENPPM